MIKRNHGSARNPISLLLSYHQHGLMSILVSVLPCLLPGILFTFIAATVAKADDMAQELPTSDQIRAHYQEAATDWPTIPRTALLAFVAAEDRQFFDRPPQISIMTQQIGRWYLQPGSGKLQRVALAFAIGEALSHDEVLDWYVNQIFMGQSCFGVSGAAMAYFGKSVADLDLGELAYLAGLPRAPVSFHPVRSYDRAIERRNHVLLEMSQAGFISAEQAASAIQTPLVVAQPLVRCESGE